jgi:hypothetical protein
MQVISNIAFFVMPALPTWHKMDASYVIAFIWIEVSIVALLLLRYGYKELGTGPRPTWDQDATAVKTPGREPSVKEAQFAD